LETFTYLFIKTPCSEANDTPPQLDWEFNETEGLVLDSINSIALRSILNDTILFLVTGFLMIMFLPDYF